MSVINQMLQGLDKGAQQQQADIEGCGAVIVAAPKDSNKLLISLLFAIVVFAALAAYLFVQKESRAAKVDIAAQAIMPAAAVENSGEGDVLVTAVLLSKDAVEKSLVEKPILDKAIASSVADTVRDSNAEASRTAKTPAAKAPDTNKVITAKIVKPAPAEISRTVTKQTVKTQQKLVAETAVEPDAVENNISIKAVTRTPLQRAQLYAKQAEAALLAGDKERAKQLFSKVLTVDKQHDLSREKLAAILYGEQRTQSAVKLLQAGLSISPEYTNFRLMLARIYLKNKNKSQAYYYLKPHQPEVDGNVDYYAILAGLAQSLGDLDTALMAYQKLTSYEPNRAKWWLGLGITADKAKQVRVALTAYHTAQNMGQLSASSRNYINARITQLEKQ